MAAGLSSSAHPACSACPPTSACVGVAAIATGVAMLVSRMRDRSPDDEGDDGAVV